MLIQMSPSFIKKGLGEEAMNYEQSLAYLASLNRFGINLGLMRIQRLLALMDNPERRYKTIHVTGSNGKGSTTAMITAILTAAGIKTGMYTSPHLAHYTERITVGGEQITPGAFAQAVEHTRQFVDEMIAGGGEHPTEFEVITAAAFYYFAKAGVEYAVIEVGLGGLLDSTNVIKPEVSVITNISLEHTDRCGDTIEAIASHKAGIIKHGVPLVTAADGNALRVIEQTAAVNEAEVLRLGKEFVCLPAGTNPDGQQIIWQQGEERLGPLTVKLLGRHQVDNAALAVMAAKVLARQDIRINAAAIRQGLAAVFWPGRFEIITGNPLFIIDGAHNPAGAEVLRQALDEYFPQKNITFILGILNDKDQQAVIRALLRPGDRVIAVAPQSDRATDPAALLQVIHNICAVSASAAALLPDAIAKAAAYAGPDGLVCVTGSLYLIGPAREIITNGRQTAD